jgi:hypothetical protein
MYHLFQGEKYYPGGGINDYVGMFATLDEAKTAFDKKNDWAQIIVASPGGLKVVSQLNVDVSYEWVELSVVMEAVMSDKLGFLAMRFRGDRDENSRREVAKLYADEVSRLVKSGRWKEMPAFEEMLPDEWMPKEFWGFWGLPIPLAGSLWAPRIQPSPDAVDAEQTLPPHLRESWRNRMKELEDEDSDS